MLEGGSTSSRPHPCWTEVQKTHQGLSVGTHLGMGLGLSLEPGGEEVRKGGVIAPSVLDPSCHLAVLAVGHLCETFPSVLAL